MHLPSSSRFPKLTTIDIEYANYKVVNYGNNFTLPELVENFRNFAASELKLYYQTDLLRLYIAALASTKLVILQGISGTGKELLLRDLLQQDLLSYKVFLVLVKHHLLMLGENS